MTLALTARKQGQASAAAALPQTILGFAWRTARLHQLWLSVLTAGVFLLNLVPLELQRRIVNEALQMFGARGYSRDLPLERMARDVRMFTIGGGTAQVLRTLVASRMLGWKLPQTRDGYAKAGVRRSEAAE